MMYPIVDLVEHQVIAAVHTEDDLKTALTSRANIVFLLTGSIFNVERMVSEVKDSGRHVFLHMEFMDGIAADNSGVAYVARQIKPTGIVSTRSGLIRIAKELGLMSIQRLFLIDRNNFNKGVKVVEQTQPDAVEIMPGVMPRVIREMTESTPLPIIAGGLVSRRCEIDEALAAGALAVSVGSKEMWF